MQLDDRRIFLRSPLGDGLTPRDVTALQGRGLGRVGTWQRGEVLALRSAPQTFFVVVLAGRINVVRETATGQRRLLDVIDAGGVCGAVSAFDRHPVWVGTAEAATDVRALVVHPDALVAQPPSAAQVRLLGNCTRLVAARALHLRGRVELLSCRSLRGRIAHFLAMRADAAGHVPVSLTRQQLADLLVVSRASMTRELGRMVDDGLVAFAGRGFRVLDPNAIRALAD